MAIEPKQLSDEQLQNVIDNFRKHKKTDDPIYVSALAEMDERKGKGLNFSASLAAITKAAKERRFISYKELADQSGVSWGLAHYAIGRHLYNLVEYSHRQGWPLLSAIVVNLPNLKTGKMEPSSLKGFISAAKLLGFEIVDEESFLREEQTKVFAWAQEGKTN
jgi:hypothetical protein